MAIYEGEMLQFAIDSLKQWIKNDLADVDSIHHEHGYLDLDPDDAYETAFKLGRAHGVMWALKYIGVPHDEVNRLFD